MIKEVTPVEAIKKGNAVIILFADGVRVTFLPYTHGIGYQIEGLQRFGIEDAQGNLVVQYNSRLYRCGPQKDEHKVALLEDGWTIEDIVAYWDSAEKYCNELFYGEGGMQLGRKPNEKYWYVWRVTREGRLDLRSLKKKIGMKV